VSIIEYINPTGGRGTPGYIFSGKSVQSQWFPEDIEKADYTATPKGWTNRTIALEWLQRIFLMETQPRMSFTWRILLLDEHTTHIDPEFIWTAYTANVALVYLPAHTSDYIQPFDVTPFSVLKQAYRRELRGNVALPATAPIYKQRMLEAYRRAAEDAFSDRNIKSGWRRSGIYPFNSAMVLENPEIYSIIPPNIETDVSTTDNEEACDIFTPRKSHDLRKQLYDIGRNNRGLPRDVRTLIAKAGKKIDQQPGEIARLQAENSRLKAQLDSHKPDK
jgi:hypothetical protein